MHIKSLIARLAFLSPRRTRQVAGFKMYIPRWMEAHIVKKDYYEKNVSFWMEKVAKSLGRPVFFDVGANFGYYSLKMSGICEEVRSFEPVSRTFEILEKNIFKNKLTNIKMEKIALSDKAGTKTINLYNSSGSNSFFKRNLRKHHIVKFTGTEEVKVETLDGYLAKEGVRPPGIIKIDVEGCELAVLKGGRKTIIKHVPLLFVEYLSTTSKDAGYRKEEIIDEILSCGEYEIFGMPEKVDDFELVKLSDFGKKEISNIMAIPKSDYTKKCLPALGRRSSNFGIIGRINK